MTSTPLRVLVAGGGVAGIEALLTLHALAGDRVELTLADAQPEFIDRPMTVAEPFARGQARHYPRPGPTRSPTSGETSVPASSGTRSCASTTMRGWPPPTAAGRSATTHCCWP